MEIFDIKRGDILVAKHNDLEDYEFERDYIIFIASGSKLSISSGNGYICYSIPVIASIDLSNAFNVGGSAGYTTFVNISYKSSELRKPTVSEMLDILSRLRQFGYKYNKKTKNIEKL
jgi:hypothetical protein